MIFIGGLMKQFKLYSFVAWVLRLRNVSRWHLMDSIKEENDAQHSFEVSVISHFVACIGVAKYKRTYCPNKCAVTALYHEISESGGVGDIPSPVKYANPELTALIKKMEKTVETNMVYGGLPDYLSPFFENIAIHDNIDPDIKKLVKAADDIAAYLKTRRELSLNNLDYLQAEINIKNKLEIHQREMPEVKDFMENHLPFCTKPIDLLTDPSES